MCFLEVEFNISGLIMHLTFLLAEGNETQSRTAKSFVLDIIRTITRWLRQI